MVDMVDAEIVPLDPSVVVVRASLCWEKYDGDNPFNTPYGMEDNRNWRRLGVPLNAQVDISYMAHQANTVEVDEYVKGKIGHALLRALLGPKSDSGLFSILRDVLHDLLKQPEVQRYREWHENSGHGHSVMPPEACFFCTWGHVLRIPEIKVKAQTDGGTEETS